MKKFIKLLAVAATVALSVNVNAQTYGSGAAPIVLNAGNTYDFLFDGTAQLEGGHLLDYVYFSLTSAQQVAVFAEPFAGLTEINVNLGTTPFTFQAGNQSSPYGVVLNLNANTVYQAVFKNAAEQSFTGKIQVGGSVAAVPEPETYALMLAGLALVGFSARRRQA